MMKWKNYHYKMHNRRIIRIYLYPNHLRSFKNQLLKRIKHDTLSSHFILFCYSCSVFVKISYLCKYKQITTILLKINHVQKHTDSAIRNYLRRLFR